MNTTNNNPIIGKLFKNNEQFNWCIVEPGTDKLLSLKKGQVFAVISPATQIESPTKKSLYPVLQNPPRRNRNHRKHRVMDHNQSL